MNKIYRVIWSESSRSFVAVPEIVKSRGGGRGTAGRGRRLELWPTSGSAACGRAGRDLLGACIALALASPSVALPTGGQVTQGAASISQSSTGLNISQSTQDVAIDWQSFNIAANEKVNFAQPNSSSVALNRVLGDDPSLIYGQLNANGQVFLINPSGVIFGRSAQVDVGGLVATTLNISDGDFMAGKRNFSGSAGSVVNRGRIDAGYVAMMGGAVSNDGTINARLGTVALAGGSAVTLDFAGNHLLNVVVDRGAVNALAENSELIMAGGGQVILTAKATNALLDTVVNNTGIIEAQTVGTQSGVIRLLGSQEGGTVQVGGTLDASAPNGGSGGFVETSGAHVQVASSAHISTAAPEGSAGTWLIDPIDFTITDGTGAQTTSGMGAATLQNNLAAGNVAITTSSSGSQNGDINVDAPVSWSANTLTLTAANNINVNAVMSVSGTAKVDFEPGTAGDLLMGFANDGTFAGRVDISSSAANVLTISGQVYTVINSLGVPGDTSGTTLQGINGNLSGNFALGSNIDASATSTWNAGAGFTVIGTGYRPPFPNGFSGKFNGLGHTISNLTIANGAYYGYNSGLFGVTSTSARISNVGVIGGGSIAGGYSSSNNIAALVGYNTGTIKNSYSNVTINVSGNNIGGLVGVNTGSMINSHALGSVTGNYAPYGYAVGGLVGANNSGGSITSSYSSGNVAGITQVGGLVGLNYGTITASYSTATVTNTNDGSVDSIGAGGFVGINYATITTSYATGNVDGGESVGGFAGQNNPLGNITDAYSLGNVTAGIGYTGGFVGQNYGTVNRSYSVGSSNGGGAAGFQSAGFVSPYQVGTVTNSFWDIDTSGTSAGSTAGMTGMTTANMQTMLNFQSATTANGSANPGWNFSTTWARGSNLYPCLLGVAPGCSGVVALTVDLLFGGSASGTATYGSTSINSGFSYELFNGGTEVTPSGVTGTVLYSGLPTITSNVGGYSITYGGGLSASGYTFSSGPALSFTVTPAILSVAGSQVYNGTTSFAGTQLTVTGVNGQTFTASGNATLANANVQSAQQLASVAGLTLTPVSGALLSNYFALTASDTMVSVTPAPLTVTAGNVSKTYGQTPTLSAFTATGLQNDQTIGSVTESSPGASANAGVASGPYAISASAASGGTFSATNYTLSYVPGSLTVTPAPLTVTADSASKVYGQTATLTGFMAAGLQNGETIGSVTEASPGASGTAGVAFGPYAISASAASGGTFNAADYNISYAPGSLTVTPAAMVATVGDATRGYGVANPAFSISYSGFVAGDSASALSTAPSLSTTAVSNSPAGIYAVDASGAVDPNYTFTYVPGMLTVSAAVPGLGAGAAAQIASLQQMSSYTVATATTTEPTPLMPTIEPPVSAASLAGSKGDGGVGGDFNYEHRPTLDLGTTSLKVLKGGIRGPEIVVE